MTIQESELSIITVDPDIEKVIAEWAGLKKEAILRSKDGKTLGHYIPSIREPLVPWDPNLTADDLDRFERESKRSKLTEIWKRLGAK